MFSWRRNHDGGPRVFEDDVVGGIALFDFFGDLGFEIVFRVLGLPVAADEIHGVFDGAIGADFAAVALLAELGDEGEFVGAAGFGEECSEGGADGSFVKDILEFQFVEGGVVGGDRLGVGRFLFGFGFGRPGVLAHGEECPPNGVCNTGLEVCLVGAGL